MRNIIYAVLVLMPMIWIDAHAEEYCDENFLTRGYTTYPLCSNQGKLEECTKILPGYKADIFCAKGFHRPSNQFSNLICQNTGKWFGTKYACVLEDCGRAAVAQSADNFDISEIPWHVGIYRKSSTEKETKSRRECSGVIYTAKLVITAAHCFLTSEYKLNEFTVVAGTAKQNEPTSQQNAAQQRVSIERLITAPHNSAFDYNPTEHGGDIAILVLANALKFNDLIKPVCINFREQLQMPLDNGVNITGAAWVKRANASQSDLSKVTLSALQLNTCQQETSKALGSGYKLATDLICGKNIYNSIFGKGDSGAGLAVKVVADNVERYYLEGILSFEVIPGVIVAATSVQSYQQMIRDAAAEYADRDENDI